MYRVGGRNASNACLHVGRKGKEKRLERPEREGGGPESIQSSRFATVHVIRPLARPRKKRDVHFFDNTVSRPELASLSQNVFQTTFADCQI